ncbi:MAG: aspartyl/asparaginyl beta-hydroxylase domain-containing protein [Pseudomonadota bacterium]
MTGTEDFNALGAAGTAALSAGDAVTARQKFRAIVNAGGGDETVWLLLALATSALNDSAETHEAIDRVLATQPANLRALVLKGDTLWSDGDHRGAAGFYRRVLTLVPDTSALKPDAVAEIERIRQVYDAYTTNLDTHLRNYVQTQAGAATSRRFAQSMELLSESAERFVEAPRAYYFPELPAVQFYDTDDFDWAAPLEARIGDIVQEFEAAMQSAAEFKPYIHTTGNKPVNPDHPLLDSMDWSALFLQQNGELIDEVASRFPVAMSALQETPLETVPGRGPSILVSRLAPGTRIEAHTGFLNTRLTCHIPLRLPGKCGLRVGNETREWEPGKLLIFNDAINHEAWNDSGEDRYVMIFQVWRPELTMDERALVSSLLQGIDSYSAE